MVVWLYVFPIGEVTRDALGERNFVKQYASLCCRKSRGIFIAPQKQTEKSTKEEGPEAAFFLNFFLDVLLFFIAVPTLILLDIG